jgi:hypothetical protein
LDSEIPEPIFCGFILCCHKGDASETQKSDETGAQSQGIVINGNTSKNSGGTGGGKNSPSSAAISANSGTQLNLNTDSSKTISGNDNTITEGLDPAAAADALEQLTNSFTESEAQIVSALQTNQNNTVTNPSAPSDYPTDSSTPTTDPSTDATATPSAMATSTGFWSTFFNLSAWQMAAAAAAILGTFYLIFKKKKRT